MSEAIRLETRGHVAVLTLDEPEKRNAMTAALIDAIGPRIDQLAQDRDVRVVVVTGSGRSFCSGADFAGTTELIQRSGLGGVLGTREAIRTIYEAFVRIGQLPQPTIAAINGHAIGGGLGIALQCDLRIVAKDAKLAVNFSRLGIHPGLGISALLPRAIGEQRALELLLTGETVRGDQATEWGFALEAVERDEVLPRAMALAERISAAAPLSLRAIKSTQRKVNARALDTTLELEAMQQALLGQTEDAREGVLAMMQKRAPKFKGR